ncbi:hypothetical protein Hanom_Chr15g01371181 [Helianthus anomalus]
MYDLLSASSSCSNGSRVSGYLLSSLILSCCNRFPINFKCIANCLQFFLCIRAVLAACTIIPISFTASSPVNWATFAMSPK